MASPFSLFKTDPDKEREGVIVNYGDEAWFKIARAGGANKRYLNMMGERLKPYRRQIQTETMDEKLADRIVMEVFTDTVLLGWGSRIEDPDDPSKTVDVNYIEDEGGARLDFNRENALRVLGELPELFAALRAEAERLGNFTAAVKEEDAKN
jgi:hypothetical protein